MSVKVILTEREAELEKKFSAEKARADALEDVMRDAYKDIQVIGGSWNTPKMEAMEKIERVLAEHGRLEDKP